MILNFLETNSDKAFYSKEIVEALKDKRVKPPDVMTTVRKAEKKGLVYVRGYRMHDRQTPFKEGYLLTWIDPNKPREQAIEEAVQKTSIALSEKSGTSPIIERIHAIRDSIIEATKLRDLVSFEFLQNKLSCSKYEAEGAVRRALQLYPDLKKIKGFGMFKYYHHASISQEDLKATIILKENYIRVTKGRLNRTGHNWEAAVEYFIDNLTTGAKFWTHKHRTKAMDPRALSPEHKPGGYLWRGEATISDNQHIIGSYRSREKNVIAKGSFYFLLGHLGDIMRGKWSGCNFDYDFTWGFGVIAKDKNVALDEINKLLKTQKMNIRGIGMRRSSE